MDRAEFVLKIKNIIALQLGLNAKTITETQSLTEDLNADSLDTVEMLMALENEFDVEASDEAAEEIKTVGDAVALIESLLSPSFFSS